MFEKMLKDMPAIFQRTTAAEWLRGQYPGMDTATVEALLLALSRTPGVQQLPRAQYRQDKKRETDHKRLGHSKDIQVLLRALPAFRTKMSS